MKLVSPSKQSKKKGLKVATLPKESGGSLTRGTAQRAGLKIPKVFGDDWNQKQQKKK